MTAVIQRQYTDLAVLVGPSLRWAQDDLEDLLKERPEVFLGYRIATATPQSLTSGALRGRRVAKFVVTGYEPYTLEVRALDWCWWWDGGMPKIEYWRVHRVHGIWRLI